MSLWEFLKLCYIPGFSFFVMWKFSSLYKCIWWMLAIENLWQEQIWFRVGKPKICKRVKMFFGPCWLENERNISSAHLIVTLALCLSYFQATSLWSVSQGNLSQSSFHFDKYSHSVKNQTMSSAIMRLPSCSYSKINLLLY